MLRTPFWRGVAQSFAPKVRARYAAQLERAERIDLFVAAIIDACGAARAALVRRLSASGRAADSH